MAEAQRREMNTSDSRRVILTGRKATDHGVTFTNTVHLSRGAGSLRPASVFSQIPAKKVMPQILHAQAMADPQTDLLLGKQWISYSVTPLYKFSYEQLQSYSKQLSIFIASKKQKNLALELDPDLMYRAKFSSVSALKTMEREPAPVLIQITESSQVAAQTKGGKAAWMGFFCCACGGDASEAVMKDFTCLPLFLAHGAKALSDLVEAWLQQTFDSCFSPLPISPLSLAHMAAVWSGVPVERYTAATELTFSVRCPTYPLDISYAIHPEDAKTLWDAIQKTEGEVRQEDVELFMECLYSHFYRHFKIHLSATTLVGVSTSVASAHSAGKIKVRSQDS